MPRNKKSAAAAAPIDWPALLLARPCPPSAWWTGEAIARGTSSLELRAEAAWDLMATPFDIETAPGSKLPQVVALANRYTKQLQSAAHLALWFEREHGDINDQIYRVAVSWFLRLKAAEEAMNIRNAAKGWQQDQSQAEPHVPELQPAVLNAAAVVRELQERGITCDLSKGAPVAPAIPEKSPKPAQAPQGKKAWAPSDLLDSLF